MRIGIDLGGTKIEGVVLSRDGDIVARKRVPTPKGDYRGTVNAIVELIRHLDRESGAQPSVGIGMPGIISPVTGRVKNANSVCLNGCPMDKDIEEALGREVRLENDANCFALSEASDGAAAGRGCVFGAILGTGTGGGVVLNGRILRGRNAVGGEWGHNSLPWPEDSERPGHPCYCGRSGCIETFLSGPGLARDYAQALRPARLSLAGSGQATGDLIEPIEIVRRSDQGEAFATACLDRYVNRLARGLASVINVLDPDAIVLGGGLSRIPRLYRDVPAQWERYVFSDHVTTELLAPKFGDASGVRGAAWLWPEP
jgi:fructokinase